MGNALLFSHSHDLASGRISKKTEIKTFTLVVRIHHEFFVAFLCFHFRTIKWQLDVARIGASHVCAAIYHCGAFYIEHTMQPLIKILCPRFSRIEEDVTNFQM